MTFRSSLTASKRLTATFFMAQMLYGAFLHFISFSTKVLTPNQCYQAAEEHHGKYAAECFKNFLKRWDANDPEVLSSGRWLWCLLITESLWLDVLYIGYNFWEILKGVWCNVLFWWWIEMMMLTTIMGDNIPVQWGTLPSHSPRVCVGFIWVLLFVYIQKEAGWCIG